MRPRSTWVIAGLCLALLCGAMAWTTHSMLGMEREGNRMADEASVQERARLALWRMESIAYRLVIDESSRPPGQFRTFASPEAVVDNKTYTSVKQGDLLALSPLLTERPEFVLLHFEMDAAGTLSSPSSPTGADLVACQAIGVPATPALEAGRKELANLRSLMDRNVKDARLTALLASLHVPATLTGNRALLWNNNGLRLESAPAVPDNASLADSGKNQKPETKTVQAPMAQNGYAQQSVTWKPEQVRQQQNDFNADEANARAVMVEKSRAGKIGTKQMQSKAAESSFPSKEESLPAAPKPSLPARAQSPPPAAQPVPLPGVSPDISDFRPFWLGDALFITRRASLPGREWLQGAWLDWDNLRAELLAAVVDHFPNARIVPAPEHPATGAHLLASLPVQLIPGEVVFAPHAFWTPLKVSLSIAWACVLLAVAAVALVLRGMMALSERRASFVSSVTHELRTPLATFKLYSEMLADGMVKEETKKQQYLETLTSEADRLGHLVENVLAYSRIERGKGPGAASAVPVSDILRRIEPRLNQRALMAGMDFSVSVPPEVTSMALRTDAGAVEQILCNLVDNACKYGRREGVQGAVELVITKERRRLCFAVRDRGPGIERGEEKKLFLPFHKSAREAAHSQPGVGLGLALCRRLAAELGGTLGIDYSWRQGASFVLKLPA